MSFYLCLPCDITQISAENISFILESSLWLLPDQSPPSTAHRYLSLAIDGFLPILYFFFKIKNIYISKL
jgi:hypothetical protein